MTFHPCALIPTYDNPDTIARVVSGVRRHLPEVLIVDDGSGERARRVIDALQAAGLARVLRRARNGGKGAAMKDGFRAALDLGYTHALAIDADDQHEADDIPSFLRAAERDPTCLVMGAPCFDDSAPSARLWGRKISVFWVHLETGSRAIVDPLCGLRVYPLRAAINAGPVGNHMEFDPEIAVRMVWKGTPVCNVPTQVRYLNAAQGGVSHFHMVRDNLRISLMHTRLCCAAMFGWLLRRLGTAAANFRRMLAQRGAFLRFRDHRRRGHSPFEVVAEPQKRAEQTRAAENWQQ